jgi:hypothetical protein
VDELSLTVTGASVEPHAAVPTISFAADIAAPSPVHALALRAQVMIEPQRRRYDAGEADRMLELFGETTRWGDSLRPFLWAHIDAMVPGFEGATTVALPLVCTYDFEVIAAKYLHGLAAGDGAGEVPLQFLFSGTAFRRGPAGFEAAMVPWHLESRFRLPVATWRRAMDRYFPGEGWLRLPRPTIDRLQRFRAERALPTWEQAVDALLKEAGAQ